jgi:hypothetical protein
MQAFIGATLLTSKESQPQSKPFEIYDNRLSGFTLRVQPSGVRSYYARFGRNRRVVIGKVDTISPEEARVRCQKILAERHDRSALLRLCPANGIEVNETMLEIDLVDRRRPIAAQNPTSCAPIRSSEDSITSTHWRPHDPFSGSDSNFCGSQGLLKQFSVDFYAAAALLESIPAWIRFLQLRELVDADGLQRTLRELQPLALQALVRLERAADVTHD